VNIESFIDVSGQGVQFDNANATLVNLIISSGKGKRKL
jgi:hypothetical protein